MATNTESSSLSRRAGPKLILIAEKLAEQAGPELSSSKEGLAQDQILPSSDEVHLERFVQLSVHRTAPVNCKRKKEGSREAIPPPLPTLPRPRARRMTTPSERRKERRKKADRGGFGYGPDELDSNDRRWGNGGDGNVSDDSDLAGQQRRQDPDPSCSYYGPERYIEHGWTRRVSRQQRREAEELRRISPIWRDLMPLRERNLEQAIWRQTRLMDFLWKHDKEAFQPQTDESRKSLSRAIEQHDQELDAYLKASLYRVAVEDDPSCRLDANGMMEEWELFTHTLEEEVIQQCKDMKLPGAEGDEKETIQSILRRMDEAMEVLPNDASLNDYRKPSDFLNRSEVYETEIIAKSFIDEMVRCAERGRDYPLGDVLPVGASDEERTRFILSNPSHMHDPTYACIEWLYEVVIPKGMRSPRLREALQAIDRSKELGKETQQVFVFSEGHPPYVSLVMFNDKRPLRVQRVQEYDLTRMGWSCDSFMRNYWRYAFLEDTTKDKQVARKGLFKVDINGALRAILGSDGKWVTWESVRSAKQTRQE